MLNPSQNSLFDRYLGASPKRVIARYRPHEAIARVQEGRVVDWTGLALSLGYFDQADFIKDFKAVIGVTPAEYARRTSSPPSQMN